jgi:superfamily II DNA/RNA helicase
MLAAAPEDVGKASRAAARFSRVVRDAPAFVALGDTEDARREQRRLEKGATIVAGTTERVIDHLRRGTLGFGDLAAVVVTAPTGPAVADFVKDVQFILEKVFERRQTILLSPAPVAEESELMKLLRHPLLIGGAEGQAGEPAPASTAGHLCIPLANARGEARAQALARLVLGMRMRSVVVYHGPRTDGRAVAEALRARGLRAAAPGSGGGRSAQERREAVLSVARRTLDVLVVPAAAGAADLQDASPTHVVLYEWPLPRPALGRARGNAVAVALVDEGQERDIPRLQNAMGVTMSRGQLPGDDEVLAGAIDRFLRRIREEDAAELAALRSRIRRQVPLLQRPLFMAALLKALLPPKARAGAGTPAAETRPGPGRAAASPRAGDEGRGQRGRFGRIEGAGRPARPSGRGEGEGAGAAGRPARPSGRGEGGFAQLFVSIGRNRRVYARDLTDLFTETLALGAGDLGSVRVFEKYSFVDIVPAKAEEAIARLSGTELKGRTITVNYAKKREEKEGA